MIAIRVDGNPQIATGHVMRGLSIANGLKKAGHHPLFIVADDISENLLSQSGFQTVNLHSEWNNLESEISKISGIIQQNNITKLIIDTYSVTEKYLFELNKICKVIYIDDQNAFTYPVSAVVNYNLYAEDMTYLQRYAGTKTKLILSPQYAPLREEFQNIEPIHRKTVENILITAGGSDTYNAAGQILQKMLTDNDFQGITIHIVAGKLNPHITELQKLALDNPAIHIHQNVTEMVQLMQSCDLAVTAGGSTMYELCACGIPSVCFSWADNQIPGVEVFSKKGIIPSAGDLRTDKERCIHQILNLLKAYLHDETLRKENTSRMRNVTDGRGVSRLVQEILNL